MDIIKGKISAFLRKFPLTLKISLFLILYTLYLSFGLTHITKFATVDETIWWIYNRVPKYWDSLLAGDIEGTFINDKPGVSVAIISGIGYNLNKESFQERISMRAGNPNSYKRVDKQDLNIEQNLLSLRLPLLIFNGLFALLLFWLIKKITDDYWISFWSFTFILMSPILLGISQIINPDTLLWSFSAGAILSSIGYMKTEERKLAVISSISLGMALLSKYTATILFPFLIISSWAYFAYKMRDWKEQGLENHLKIKKISITSILITAGSVLTYAIGMPAVFKNMKLLSYGTVGFPGMEYFLWPLVAIQILLILESIFFKNKFSILAFEKIGSLLKKYSYFLYSLLLIIFAIVLINWTTNLNLFNLTDLRFDLERGAKKFLQLAFYEKFIYEARPLIFSLTPITLFALLLLWIKTITKKKFNFLTFIISVFLLIFYSAVIFEGLMVTIRYSIMLYPLVMILAAFGIKELYAMKFFKKINTYVFSLIIILISSFSLWATKPFYFNYTNSLLPNDHLITGAWGYGGYEAAQHLNSLPNSENFIIWADNPGVCEFTKGRCYTTNRIPHDTIDYFVLTRRGKITYARAKDQTQAKQYYEGFEPVWNLIINDRPGNFIKIFKNKDK